MSAADTPMRPLSDEDGPSKETTLPAHRTLRWWPAAVLLVLGIVLRYGPSVLEAPSLPVLMVGFMGPGVIALLILVWWLFASRASVKEKIVGFVGVLSIASLTMFLVDYTIAGMNVAMYVVPCGIAFFAVALILLANVPVTRVMVALVSAAIGFGGWTMLRSEGVTGTFAPEFSWRWQPSAEQAYIAQLAEKSSNTAPARSIEIDGSTSQWPSFRGMKRDGKQPGLAVMDDWTSNPPKQIWKQRIGPGWSSFSAASGVLFTQEQRGDNEAIVCMDAKDGTKIWDHEYPSRFWESIAGAGPRATPTITALGLFALGADGILVSLNPSDGSLKWQRDLKKDAGREPPMWGFSSSPLVHDGVVMVHAGGAGDKGVLAYDAVTGDLRWSVASGDHSYSSPHLATFAQTTGVLMQTNLGLQFINASDGQMIWQHEWSTTDYRAIQPLVLEDAVILATSLGMGSRRVGVKKEGEQWLVNEEWTSMDMKPDYNDFVDYDGFIYGFDGSIFACIDLATGERKWKKGRYGNGQVLLLSDSGQMLVVSEKGELVLVNATPEKLDEVAKIQAIEGKTWNHPILLGNRIYLRNGQEAACYELPQKTQEVASTIHEVNAANHR
jgi:outer membrane protein assembly factor BamB